MIDPQLQANKWIRKLEEPNNLKIVKANDYEGLSQTVDTCIRLNYPCLVEDCEEDLNPFLDPLLLKQFTYKGSVKLLKLGDSEELEVEDDFRIYFSTKMSNPNFLPEIFIRVSIINFTVTEDGLEEQLLADVIREVMPEIEEKKVFLIVSIAEGKNELRKNEDKILELLKNSDDNILEDNELVKSLEASKIKSDEVKLQLVENETAQVQIEEARNKYKSVAIRGSLMYFVVTDLTEIDPMYQFSLTYFTRLFVNTIRNCEKLNDVNEQWKMFINRITEDIYLNVCRGLFNDHKKIFAFLLNSKIHKREKLILGKEWDLFLTGIPVGATFQDYKMPPIFKMDKKNWDKIWYLASFNDSMKEMVELIIKDVGFINQLTDNWASAIQPFTHQIPRDFETKLSDFQKLLLIQILRPDAVLNSILSYIEKSLGPVFASNEAPKFGMVFKDCDHKTPMIFVLSPGSDPLSNLQRFAADSGAKLTTISLGQGQGVVAQKAVLESKNFGGWVLLQNCHLSKSFMPELEVITEKLGECTLLDNTPIEDDKEKKRDNGFAAKLPEDVVHPSFRLILTSMPCDYFPITILQNGVKLTNEPPKGVKANMMKTFNDFPIDKLESVGDNKKENWKNLLFSFSLFHSIILERRKFGPLGYNILYDFNESDLDTTLKMLEIMLKKYSDVPYEALRYLTAEINYGGRVTDEWDRRTVKTVLDIFFSEDSLVEGTCYTDSNIYYVPKETTINGILEMIKEYPEQDSPLIFGMNSNAEISYQIKESKKTLEIILQMQPADGGGDDGQSPDDIVQSFVIKLQSSEYPTLILKEGELKPGITNYNDPLEV